MTKKFWSITEVVQIFQIEEHFLSELEEEEVICPSRGEDQSTRLFSYDDLERLRLAKILVEDMGVNMAGVEVILRMKKSMNDMRRQFDAILEDLAKQIQKTILHRD